MNRIYLSGIVADPPVQYAINDRAMRVVFPLCVSHRTKQGLVKREVYTVQAWNKVGEWAHGNLRQGQRVMVQGYLTQHGATKQDGSKALEIEITAEEFFPAGMPQARQVNAQPPAEQAEVC